MNGCELPIKTSKVFDTLKAELGSDVDRLVELHALTVENENYTQDFKTYCINNFGIEPDFNSEDNVDTITLAIKDYALSKNFSVKYASTMQNATDASVVYGYSSDLARVQCATWGARKIANVISNIQLSGKTFAQESGNDDLGNVKSAKDYLCNELEQAIVQAIVNNFRTKVGIEPSLYKHYYESGNIAGLQEYAARNNAGIELTNLIAFLREIKNPDSTYFTDVFHSKELTQFNIKELKDVLDEISDIAEDEENDTAGANLSEENENQETKDDSYSTYENHLGLLSDAAKLIPIDLKLYLNGVPKLNSDKKIKDDYDLKVNENTGLEEYTSYKEAQAVLFSYVKYDSPETMIASMRTVASVLPGAKWLYKVADDCKTNINLCNKIFRNFKKTRIGKQQIIITDEGTSCEMSNNDTDKDTTLFYQLQDDLKHNLLTGEKVLSFKTLESAIYDTKKYLIANPSALTEEGLENVANTIAEQVYKFTKQYFPTIRKESIYNFANNKELYFNNDVNNPLDLLYKTIVKINDSFDRQRNDYNANKQAIELANSFNYSVDSYIQRAQDEGGMTEAAAKKSAEKLGKIKKEVPAKIDLIKPSFRENIGTLIDILGDYVAVNVSLNSKNAKGDQSTDHINDSWITYLNNVFSNRKALELFGDELQGFGKKIQSIQGDFNTLLIEDPEIGNKGLFRLAKNGKYVPTEYADKLLRFDLFDGVNNRTTGEGSLHVELNDRDYLLSALHAFVNSKKTFKEANNEHFKGTDFARYLLRTPSDATNNFMMTAPIYHTDTLYEEDGSINRDHTVFKQFRAAAIQKLTNCIHVAKACCIERDGKISNQVKENILPLIKNTRFIMNGDEFFDENGKPTGNIFKSSIFSFNKINPDGSRSAITTYDDRLMSIASFFHDGINDAFDINNTETRTRIAFTEEQRQQIDNIVEDFIKEYTVSEIGNIVDKGISDQYNLEEFVLNYRLAYLNMDTILEGDLANYKSTDDLLKRAKEVQGSGTTQASYNTLGNTYSNTPLDINLTVTRGNKKVAFNQTRYNENMKAYANDNAMSDEDKEAKAIENAGKVLLKDSFKGVVIANSEITESGMVLADDPENDGHLVKAIRKNMENSGLDKTEAIAISRRIAEDYKEAKANDAQSYITFEEFIRRLAQKGQLTEYKPLIEKILNEDEPITAEDLKNFIQVQKNFYFDHRFIEELGINVSRQIKNSEYVLIPRFIKGTDLEKVYNLMEKHGIDQINTKETSKAFTSSVLTLFDKDGNLTDENIKKFEEALAESYVIEEYKYMFLYTQQEGVQHINATNKVGLQIYKKILDNIIDSNDPRYKDKQDFVTALVNNILDSWNTLAKDIEFTVINGDRFINVEYLLEKFKKQADTLGLDTSSYDYLTLEQKISDLMSLNSHPLTKMPMELSAFSQKLENIANAFFNTVINKQTLPGFHGAQVSGIGVGITTLGKKGTIKQDKYLQYHPKLYIEKGNDEPITQREYDNLSEEEKKNYQYSKIADYIEIRIPRSVYPFKMTHPDGSPKTDDDLLQEMKQAGIDTVLGYRIPSESKHSIAKMKIVGFLDEAEGTTIEVPTGWVPQTGSDFDIDSIYGITYDVANKNGYLTRELVNKTPTDEAYIEYIKNSIKTVSNKQYEALTPTRKKNNKIVKSSEFTNRNAKRKEIENAAINQIKENRETAIRDTFKYIDSDTKRALAEIKKNYGTITKENAKEYRNKQIELLKKNIKEYNEKEGDDNKSRARNLQIHLDALVGRSKPIRINRRELFKEHNAELTEAANKDYLAIASKVGLMDRATFDKAFAANPMRYATRRARNNTMINAMSNILGDERSWEEMFSASGFADVKEAIRRFSNPELKETSANRTPYSIVDQSELHGAVISGKKLKGNSVMMDSAASIFSQTRAVIDTPIQVMEETFDKTKAPAVVSTNKLCWSHNGNRNFEGKLITDYVSQSTSHQLDVVKEGPVPNVTEDTFNDYKMLTMLGFSYNTAISFISQPAITSLVKKIANSKSVYSDSYSSSALHEVLVDYIKDFAIISGRSDIYETAKNTNTIEELVNAFSKGDFADAITKIHGMHTPIIAGNSPALNIMQYSNRAVQVHYEKGNKIKDNSLKDKRISYNYNYFDNISDADVLVCLTSDTGVNNIDKDTVDISKRLNKGEVLNNTYSSKKNTYGITIHKKDKKTTTHDIINNILALYNEASKPENANKTFKVNFTEGSNFFGYDAQELANMFIMAAGSTKDGLIPSNVSFHRSIDTKGCFIKNANIDAVAFDCGVLFTYNKLHNIVNEVMKVVKHLRYDKEGAKQTIYETKQLEDDLQDLVSKENKDSFVKTETGENLLKAIYDPVNGDIANSAYPILAAYHEYSTKASIAINSSLFITTQNVITQVIDSYIEDLRHTSDEETTTLTKDEYAKVNKYIVGQMFANTLRDNVITLEEGKPKITKVTTENALKRERNRMQGINYSADILFNGDVLAIDDLLNLTEEQIAAFSSFSPAQKVLWLQQHIEEDTIFDRIKVVLSNPAQKRRLGYSKHNMYLSTKDVNFDDLRIEFKLAYTSRSPIVKLAALDLIKYAVEIEQYNFDTKGICSFIPNEYLMELGIIDKYRTDFYSTDFEKIIDSYVAKTYNSNKKIKQYVDRKKEYHPATNKGLIITTDNTELGKACKIGKGDTLEKYIKIKRYNTEATDTRKATYDTILYSVERYEGADKGNILLIPVNPIEENDIDFNNPKVTPRFNNKDFYIKLARAIIEENAEAKTPIYTWNSDKIKEVFGDEANVPVVEKVPTIERAKDFDIKNAPIQYQDGFQNIIDETIKHFSQYTSYLYVRNAALSNYIANGAFGGSIQTIDGKEYYIKKLDAYPINKKYIIDEKTKEFKTTLTKAQEKALNKDPLANIIKESRKIKQKVDNIFVIMPLDEKLKNDLNKVWGRYSTNKIEEVVDETVDSTIADDNNTSENVDVHNMYSDIIEDINEEALNPIERFAVRSTEIINLHNRKEDNDINRAAYNRIKDYRITNNDDISSFPTKDIIAVTRNYLEQKLSEFNTKLAAFTTINGNPIPMNSDICMRIIKTNPDEMNRFIHTILEIQALRDEYEVIEGIALSSEDPDVNNDLNHIKQVISELKSNTDLKLVWRRFFEDYVASLSSDPRIKDGMINLFESFYNTNSARYLFENIQENHTPIVQLIMKSVMDSTRASEIATENEVRKFNKELEDLEKAARAKGKPINYDNFIDENGVIIREYSSEFVDDFTELLDNLNEIEKTKGRDSIEYHRAHVDLMKFKHDNIEQPLIATYYESIIKLDEGMLNGVGADIFVAYKKITKKLREFNLQEVDGELTPELEQQRTETLAELSELLSEHMYDPRAGRVQKPAADETTDTINNINAVNALKRYVEKSKAIRELYFESKPKLGWEEKLIKNLKIVEDYEIKFGGKVPLSELEKYPDYVNAKRWLHNNSKYVGNKEERDRVNEAYTVLKNNTSLSTRGVFNTLVKEKHAKDHTGVVDGRVFDDEDIAKIKEAQEKRYNVGEGVPYSTTTLLGNGPKTDDIFTKEFYKSLTIDGLLNSQYISIVKQINAILIKYQNPITGEINTSSISLEDLNTLAPLYRKITYTPNEHGFDPEYIKKKIAEEGDADAAIHFITENCESIVDDECFARHSAIAKTKGLEYYIAWCNVNLSFNAETGVHTINPRLYGSLIPRGYREGEDNEYIDHARTEALKTIKSLVKSEPTNYYYEARREKRQTLSKEDYNAWYEANHIYNPTTRQVEPIDCWMTTTIETENETEKFDYTKYEPSFNNIETTPKTLGLNSKFNTDITNPYANFKTFDKTSNRFNSTNYDNNKYQTLSDEELAVKQLFEKIIESKAITRATKRHFAKGYMPSEYKAGEYSVKDFIVDAGEVIGFKHHKSGYDPYDYNVGYTSSYMRQLPMATILENKDSVRLDFAKPKREHYLTDDEYKTAMNEYKDKLKKAEESNLAIHKGLINRNWKNVMGNFIRQANDYATIKNNEGLLFAGQQFLKEMYTYKTLTGINKIPVINRLGIGNKQKYASETDNNILKEYNVFLNRYINKQYRQPNGMRTSIADSLQTFTSAMYMSGNVLGGIANVTVGNINILMEAVAGELLGKSTWTMGRIEYDKAMPYFLKDMYSDKASHINSALVKLFNIVDFDQFTGVVDSNNVSKFMEKARDIQYAPQHMGEHRMQNSVLLGMMHSHRLYMETDASGNQKPVAKSLNDVLLDYSETALKSILNEKQLRQYDEFKKWIKADTNRSKDYILFNKDFVTEFVNNGYVTYEQRKQFIKAKADLKQSITKEFNDDTKHPKLITQFELKDGYAQIKQDSVLGAFSNEDVNNLLGTFKNRVILFNDRIHGTYDKLGAGAIETKWWGRLVTQYHKHIYPGIMKHYRAKGYFNEVRGTVEKGMWQSTLGWLTMPFRDKKFRKELEEDLNARGINGSELLDFAEINQNVLRRALNLYQNVVLNYKTMSDVDKANVKRGFAELAGPAIAIALVVLARLGADDDDEEHSLAYHVLIHEMDRLSTEVMMYNPFGLIGEGKKLWSSPVAAQSALGGIINICGYTFNYLTDEDYDWVFRTGVNAGENKVLHNIEKRIPLYHSIYNIKRLPKNNKFFKLEHNYFGIGLADPIVNVIKE